MLRQLFENARDKTSEMLERLILGKTVSIQYNEKITFLDLNAAQSEDAVNVIGNFLLFSGYLTRAEKSDLSLDRFMKVKIENILNQALQSMSFMDEHENFYHGYMLLQIFFSTPGKFNHITKILQN